MSRYWQKLIDESQGYQEDGHADVASALVGIRVAREALNNMEEILSEMNPEDNLPSWWTNKVDISVSQLDDMADILKNKV